MQKTKHIGIICALLLSFGSGVAQLDKTTMVYQQLKAKDSLLFRAAFDLCDSQTMADLFTEDFEFYHDRVGITLGRDNFLESFQQNCELRDPDGPQPAKRMLIPGSLEVYPLYKNGTLYGAIQHGVHRFEFLNEEGVYQRGDIARFTHIWVKSDGKWKIKRELSYDHQPSVSK
jgi:ketosteroid isomerase-like protein